ncbi:hypothetical protein ES705_38620 [subsurface metagenome]
MKETLRHIEAFNYYYILGNKRSITEVARKFTVCRASVSKWSRFFHWKERVKQTDIEVSEILKKRLKKAAVYSKDNYRALVKEVMDQFEEKLKDKKIKLSKPQDIIEMMKLDLLMMGEPTGREEHLVTHKLIEVDISKYPKQNEENNIST